MDNSINKNSSSPIVLSSCKQINTSCKNEVFFNNLHLHKLFYVKSGKLTFTISGNTVETKASALLFIKKYTPYTVSVNSENFHIIKADFSYNPSFNNKEFSFLEDNYKYGNYSIIFPGPKTNLAENFIKISSGSVDALEKTIKLISFEQEISRHYYKNQNSAVCDYIKEYIDRYYLQEITVWDMAKDLGMSESFLSHSFKEAFKISPKKYILQKRTEKAKELLLTTDMSSKDISRAVGFSSPQRFNDIFKKYQGVSPLIFKKTKE
ncbi:MAG: helix-turn-helix transcriptional regulator [Clostridia bacterium]|nr:helix-turn-helix transcriptional regulator [Clostridia bacterium]